jgi:hypothetical protein
MKTTTKVALGICVGGILLASRSKASVNASSSGRGTATSVGGSNIKLLGQGDPAWASLAVGFSTRTMSDIGCVLTALTMAINALTGQQLSPIDVNAFAKAMGNKGAKLPGFDGASIFSSNVASLLGCRKTTAISDSRNVPEIRALIDDTLAKGGLALVRVDYELGTPNSNHTIVCFRRTPAGYECADPAGTGKIITLNNDLFIQRTSTRQYFGVGCAPIFKA